MKIETIVPQIPNTQEIFKKINKCFKKKYLTNDGQNLIEFEIKLQKYFKSKLKPVVFCNGELSLFNLIQAWKFNLGINKCTAIVPSFTFSGTVNALEQNNIKPLFCDINNTLTPDLKKIKIEKNTKFIVASSVYGNIPNIKEIKNFAKKNNLIFILDNAPGFFSRISNDFPCNMNVDEIYSFHATKTFNSIEGGCAITSNKKIYKSLVALRNFGQLNKGSNNIILPGLNSKMHELSAIVGIENLKKTSSLMIKRKKVISKYLVFFKELEVKRLINLMKVNKNTYCSYYFFPIILKRHSVKKFIIFMNKKKIFCRRYYKSVHTLDYYKKRITRKDLNFIPFTEKIKNKVIAIPLHSEMQEKEMNYLFDCVNKFFDI